MLKKSLFIVASALFLHFSIYYPALFFWLSFFWLVPIFYLVFTHLCCPSFLYGFLWGCVFFSLHTISILNIIIEQSEGFGVFIFPTLLISYCAMHSGFWFFFANKTAILFGNQRFARATSWIFWTVFFLLWVPHNLLWVAGNKIGYPFSFPLLPLVQVPLMLSLLATWGRAVLTLFSIFIAIFFAAGLAYRNRSLVGVGLIFFFPFLYGFLITTEPQEVPSFIKTIGYVRPPSPKNYVHPMDAAQEICINIRSLLRKNPDITYFVMPELSFRFPLNIYAHVIKLWKNNALRETDHLFLGTCRSKKNGNLCNSLCWIKEGKIYKFYDKKLLMPLAESIPTWCKNIPSLAMLFLQEGQSFFPGKREREAFSVSRKISFFPQICADFFLSSEIDMSDNACILLILNDSFINEDTLPKFMLLWAKFKALELNKSILFVGYQRALWITPEGREFAIFS